MATTRLMPLHTGKGRTVGQAISAIIDYTENPQKTDGGRENRFLAGGAEISRRGGGYSAAPVRTKAPHRCKARAVMVF